MGLIYKITNPSGHIYIGQTMNFKKRFKSYKNGLAYGQPKLYNSFIKHGFDNHIFNIIEDDILIENLDEKEVYYIKYFDCVKTGMNCTYEPIAFMRGRYHSKDTKLKMSIKRKGIKHGLPSELHIKNLSNSIKEGYKNGRKGSRLGVKLSNETKQKLRVSRIGKIISKETRDKISKAGLNRKHSKETKQKMSENNGMKKISSEQKLLILEMLKIPNILLREVATKFNLSISTIHIIKVKNLLSPR